MDRSMDRYRDSRPCVRDTARDSVTRRPSPPSVKKDKDMAGERGRSTTKPSGSEHQARAASSQSSSAAPPSRASSTSSSGGSLRSDVRRATEHLCERLFWYMQRDAVDKKLQRLQSDFDRCAKSQPDFGSVSELIRHQRDSTEEEKARFCARLDAADEKLQSAVQQLLARLPQPRSDDGAKSQSGPRPIERSAPDLESRLSAAQKSTEASLARMLSEESSLIKKSLRTEFESKTTELQTQAAELKAQLHIEKLQNEQLRKGMRALEHKIRDSAQDDDGEDRRKPQPDTQAPATSTTGPAANLRVETAEMQAEKALVLANKIKEETKGLVSRDELNKLVRKFNNAMSSPEDGSEDGEVQNEWSVPGEETALKLRALFSKVIALESDVRGLDAGQTLLRIQNLSKEVEFHKEVIQQQADQQREANLAIQTLELNLGKYSASQPKEGAGGMKEAEEAPSAAASANVTDSRIRDISRAEVMGVLREFLPIIRNKLMEFLTEERERRESVSKETEKAADVTAALRTDLEALKQDCARSLNELAHQVAKLNSDLLASGHKLEALETTCPAARADTKLEMDELAMQVRDVQSWQNNFTTRPLYKDIVDHVNATLPNGVMNQLKSLVMRIESIEGHLHATEGGDMKRRKVQAAHSAAFNGGHQG